MLTPSKIKNHHFEASGKNSYRAQSVDDFFDIVADSYEQMFKENGELVKKISLLAERLEEYRNDEDNIRAALLTAQRMADQIMRETNEKAENQLAEAATSAKKIEEDAAAKANEVIAQAQAQADAVLAQAAATAKRLIEDATAESKEQAVIARDRMIKTQAALGLIEQEADKFKKELLSLYTEHIELISRIPELQEEQVEEEPVVEEPAAEEPVIAEPVTEEPEEVTPAEEVIEDVVIAEDEIENEVDAEEEEEDNDEISDDKLRDLGFDVPAKEDDEPASITFDFEETTDDAEESQPFSFIDEDDDTDDETDDGYDKDDGIKLDISSLKFGSVDEDDDDEYYDDDDEDDDYYDDDEDDDDEDGGFGSKLKGFFKR